MSNKINKIRDLYDQRSKYGKYSTLAPGSKGNLKSKYVATVFNEALLPLISSYKENQFIFDFGCGTGIFIKSIKNNSFSIIGGDISFEMLKIANDLSNKDKRISLLMVDGINIPIKDDCIDCVMAREVLCHVPDSNYSSTFQDLYNCLKPGGKLIVLDQVSQSKKWQNYEKTPLIKKRSIENVIEIAYKAGFVLQQNYVVRKPRFPWIYLFQLKLLPTQFLKPLARAELKYNKYFSSVRTNRWHDVLFIFIKKA